MGRWLSADRARSVFRSLAEFLTPLLLNLRETPTASDLLLRVAVACWLALAKVDLDRNAASPHWNTDS
eukprot:3918659-Alexandrium_andersonii.AAC.1